MKHKNTKRFLMLIGLIGVIAVATSAGSGTFAGFNAEVANTGNYFATGTMFLHATKQGSSNICKSEVDGGNSNILSTNGCQTLFNLSNLTAGQTAFVNLQLDNAGSINASKLEFSLGSAGCHNGQSVITTTNTGGTLASGAQTTITVAPLPYALVSGTQLTITDGTNSDTLTLHANAAASATSIDVTGSTTTHTYANGSNIEYAATFGTSNLCSNLEVYVQEMNSGWSTNQKCIYPSGGSTNCAFSTNYVSGIPTYPTLHDFTADLWANGMTSALDAGGTRWIRIGIQAPGSLTNANQNQAATFDLVWHIEQ